MITSVYIIINFWRKYLSFSRNPQHVIDVIPPVSVDPIVNIRGLNGEEDGIINNNIIIYVYYIYICLIV